MWNKLALGIASLSLVVSIWALKSAHKADLKDQPKEDMTAMVEKAIKEKPQMIEEAIAALYKQNMDKEKKAQGSALSQNKETLFHNAADPIGGNPKGDLVMVEFFDYRCGYCRRVYGMMAEALAKDGNVKLIYKELPIFGEDTLMARSALAAHAQGKYEDFHKALINSTGDLNAADLKMIAEKIGLDIAKWEKDRESDAVKRAVEQNIELGKSLGITGTPTFIIEDEIFPGALGVDQFKKAFELIRKKKK
jgi:protein-disulfide isomerase